MRRCRSVRNPILVLHGTEELSASGVDEVSLSVYAAAGPPKHLVVIEGANHFGYTDELCVADDPGTISPGDQRRIAIAYITAFLRHYASGVTGLSAYLTGQRAIEELERFRVTVDAEPAGS